MFYNLLKTIFRSFSRFKLHTFINISGLALGIFVIILISAYISHELSYDEFYKDKDQIYRIEFDEGSLTFPAPLSNLIENNIPEIKNISRIGFLFADWMLGGNGTLKYNDNVYSASDVICVDTGFFNIFQPITIKGDLKQALKLPMSVVLTESEAIKIFGHENPVGKTLTANEIIPLKVTAVIKDIPSNSSLQYKYIIPFTSLRFIFDNNLDNNWGSWNYFVYVKLNKNTKAKEVNGKITELAKTKMDINNITLNPLTQIYLDSNQSGGVVKKGSKQQLYIFISVAIIVLIIGIINYINLTNAKYIHRIKEIGIRKVVGAQRRQLMIQILVETTLLIFIALLVSLSLIAILSNQANTFLNVQNIQEFIFNPGFVSSLVICAITLAFISGLYPSVFLTSKLETLLKNDKLKPNQKHYIQNSLIVFQFVVSFILISTVFFIHKQFIYIQNQELGFDKESLLHFSLPNNLNNEKFNSLKQELTMNSYITEVGRCNTIPGKTLPGWTWGIRLNGEEKKVDFLCITVDAGFINTLGLNILKGRNFRENSVNDIGQFIINEKFYKKYGIDSLLTANLGDRKILGVVEDFNAESLHSSVQPLALRYVPQNTALGIMRFSTNNANAVLEVIQYLKKVWGKMGYSKPLEYYFLENTIENLYNKEKRAREILIVFSLLTLFVSMIGLFGLSMFLIKLRSKEIGIRKINGARIIEILSMLNNDYLKWVIISFIIACPVTWYIIYQWLQNFAYRTEISWWIFVIAGAVIMITALFTISWQSWQAAKRNPVEALRYE